MKTVKAKLVKTNGEVTEIVPAKGKHFSLKELQGYVGGTIDIQGLPKDKLIIILNDNGKIDGMDINEKASGVWQKNYPIEEYPFNNDGLIVGDVVIGSPNIVR